MEAPMSKKFYIPRPWEMTARHFQKASTFKKKRDELGKDYGVVDLPLGYMMITDATTATEAKAEARRNWIIGALRDKLSIPGKVLTDYPDLAKEFGRD